MDDSKLKSYKIASNVCQIVYNEIIGSIAKGCLDLEDLTKYGDILIQKKAVNALQNEPAIPLHKNSKHYIAFPCSLSLNDCVGNYVYQKDNCDYNKIKHGDVVKVELGVNINGCVSLFAHTYVHNENSQYLAVLDLLEEVVLQQLKTGNVNDEVRMHVESLCAENDCFPFENCISYGTSPNYLKTQESKYIIFNFQKYYDDDDNLVQPNTCFELEEGEIYNINITIVENQSDCDSGIHQHVYKEFHKPHIYCFNDYFYGLKLKSSKEFYLKVKGDHRNNAFRMDEYSNVLKYKMGMKESYDNGILEAFPVYYTKDNCKVYSKKFTAQVTQNGGVKL